MAVLFDKVDELLITRPPILLRKIKAKANLFEQFDALRSQRRPVLSILILGINTIIALQESVLIPLTLGPSAPDMKKRHSQC